MPPKKMPAEGRRLIKQLSFENLAQRRAPSAERVVPNPSAPVEIRPRLKRQAEAIYAALKRGPLWTNDLRSMVAQYNARIKELRAWLRASGMTIDMTARGKDGNNRYEIKPFAGSRYQAELMQRQRKTIAPESTEGTKK